MKQKNNIKRVEERNRTLFILAFLAVPLLLLIVFSLFPAGKLVFMSFTEWKGLGPYKMVGFQNYRSLLKSGEMLTLLQNVMAYVIIMLLQTIVGFFFALVLDSKLRGRTFFKLSLFLPYMINGVAVLFMFRIIYNFDQGPINALLRAIGLGDYAIQFISESYFTNFSLAAIGMWRFTGFNMVLFLGGLQAIPKDLYEAAEIDGASYFQKVRFITLPSIRRTVELNLLLGFNGALQAYFEPFIMTRGGPAGRTDTFITKSLQLAFDFQSFGKASALAVMLVIMIFMVLGIVRLITSKGGDDLA